MWFIWISSQFDTFLLFYSNNLLIENILYSKTDKYKISDLGLSRIAKRSKGEEISEGDSRYLAPELLMDITDGNLPDLTKADIFSLGVTIYELMTSKHFFF